MAALDIGTKWVVVLRDNKGKHKSTTTIKINVSLVHETFIYACKLILVPWIQIWRGRCITVCG